MGPGLLHPRGDALIVAFGGATDGVLGRPADAVQLVGGAARGVGDAEQLLDHRGDAGQGQAQVIGPEPIRLSWSPFG